MNDSIRERFEAEALKSKVLGDVAERADNLVRRLRENAEFLYRSGGLTPDLSPEDKAAVLFVAALMDIGAQIEVRLKRTPRLRKAINNMRRF